MNEFYTVSLEDSIDAMANAFLEKHDPVQRAERLLARKARPQKSEPSNGSTRQRKLPSKSIHAVNLRDKGRCVYVDSKGKYMRIFRMPEGLRAEFIQT